MTTNTNKNDTFKAVPFNKELFQKVEDAVKTKIVSITKRDGNDTLVGMFTSPTVSSGALFRLEKYEIRQHASKIKGFAVLNIFAGLLGNHHYFVDVCLNYLVPTA